MSRAEELAAQSLALSERRLESDGYDWSVDADVQLREDAAELRRLDAENAQLRAELELTNEMNAQLREQNTLVDQACADIEHKLISTENVLNELRAELEAIYSAVPVAWMHESGNATYAGPDAGVASYNIPLIQKPVRKS